MRDLAFYSALHDEYKQFQQGPPFDIVKLADLGKRLKLEGFLLESDACFRVCLKALEKFATDGNISNCLALENFIYDAFVKTSEKEEHYFKCFSYWSPMLQLLGRQRRRNFEGHFNSKKICFVLQAGVLLGHTEVMLKLIDVWIEREIAEEIYVAALGKHDPEFWALLEMRGVKTLSSIDENGVQLPVEQAISRLGDRLEAIQVKTAVWVSVPTWASFALAQRVAPRQVFWSLKFHPLYLSDVDLHLCGGHEIEETRVYHGNTWTVSPFPLTVAMRGSAKEEVAQFRQQLPSDIILLGSIAREEKFNSPNFLAAVGTILARNPKAHYLWTGRSQPQAVLNAFQQYGVADRCHFLGWVDTNLVAAALDIFLETFPFGCGVTGFQAMGHGTPLLSMQAMDTLYGYQLYGAVKKRFGDGVVPRSEFEALDILTGADQFHYIELAQRLIDDPGYRNEIGQREKAYFKRELDALPRYAERLWVNMTGEKI